MNANKPRSTFNQFSRVLAHERPGFIFSFAGHLTRYLWHKYWLKSDELVRVIHGSRMSFDLSDIGIARSLLLVGDREREHRYMLEKVIKPGDTILDLGANIGYYVLMELKIMQNKGQVIAVEPAKTNFDRLCKNLRLNDREDKVIAINAAVTDEDGIVNLNIAHLSNVHSLLLLDKKTGTGQSEVVKAVALATLARQFPNINLIRMDIEGYEQTILQSLGQINKRVKFSPNILFELHPATYDHDKFIGAVEDLARMGYQVKLLASSNLTLLKKHGCHIETAIKTDGTVRYIANDLPWETFTAIYPTTRAVLLAT